MLDSPFIHAFNELCNILESKPKLKVKVERELPKAKTDEERVALVAPLLRMMSFSPISTTPEKSEIKSTKLREDGNRYFQQKCFEEAVKSYNESISVAPVESETKVLALAFANRSVALKELGDLENSIADSKRALEFGYPENLQYKLYTRLGHAYQQLGLQQLAEESFAAAKVCVVNAQLSELKLAELKSQMDKNIETCKESQLGGSPAKLSASKPAVDSECFLLSSEPSVEMPSSSDSVTLCHNTAYGRHLVAARDIDPGEVLISESPYASVLFTPCKMTHCSHCFKQCRALLPCPTCAQAMFCSPECRETAWGLYHEFECPLLTSVINFNPGTVTLLTVRVFALAGIANLSAFLENPPSRKKANKRTFDFNSAGQLSSADFLHIYHLETGTTNRPYLEKLGRSLVANYLLQILKLDTLPNFDKLGGFLMKISQSLSLHCFEFVDVVDHENRSFEKADVGAAVYANINMLNHACDPNVFLFYRGNTGVIVAVKPIPKGSQIFLNYKPHFLEAPSFARQAYLKNEHFFHCRCEACYNDWPMAFELPSLIPYRGSDPELRDACSLYREKCKNFKSMKTVSKDDVPILIGLLKTFDTHGKRLTKEFCACQDALKYYYMKNGNYYLM